MARRNLANQLAKTQSDSHNPGVLGIATEAQCIGGAVLGEIVIAARVEFLRAGIPYLFPRVDAATPLRAAVVVARCVRAHVCRQHVALAADRAAVDVGPCTLVAIIGRV